MKPKYPEVIVKLAGNDGNAFAIMARVKIALKQGAKASQDEIDQYLDESMSSDYNNLLWVASKWVTVE